LKLNLHRFRYLKLPHSAVSTKNPVKKHNRETEIEGHVIENMVAVFLIGPLSRAFSQTPYDKQNE